ncbi:MAG: S8 family serine peptidase [Candidatus Omnitrophica bacterium]|nr:S8 family serine peptidase [Candidatus Omnitrophota bacterium]
MRRTGWLEQYAWVVVGSLILLAGPVEAVLKDAPQAAPSSSRPNRTSSQDNKAGKLHHEAPYAKGHFIVKFKSEGKHVLTDSAPGLLAKSKKFQTATADGSDSIDQLNKRFKVHAIKGLFEQREGLTNAQAKTRHEARLATVKAKFPKRTRRAPKDTPLPDLTQVYTLEVPDDTDVAQAVALYQQDPHVEYAQPDYLMEVTFVPNDPYYSSCNSFGQGCPPTGYDDLWGLKKIQAAQAWDVTQGLKPDGTPVLVAVVDTGLDYAHPDIAANVWTNTQEIPENGIDDDGNGFIDDVRGWDTTTCAHYGFLGCAVPKMPGNDPIDHVGHGTHVSGTIAAIGNNNLGIIGVAPKVQLMPVKGLNDDGVGLSSWLASALLYAAQNGAEVINNSWGGGGSSNPVIEDAIRTVNGLGVVVVFAAGNSSDDVAFGSPENMTDPKPIVVAASTPDDTPAFFTNFGHLVDVTAPGGGSETPPPTFEPFRNILSLKAATCHPEMCPTDLIVGTNYVRQAGTSMASPHATGVAALVLAHHPTFTPEEVRQVLRASADDVSGHGFDLYSGAGRLNASRALTVDSVLNVKIESPADNSSVNMAAGSVTITGTAAGPNFQRYELFYKRLNSFQTQWMPIGTASGTPMVHGTLGTWDLSTLPIGDTYFLRLVATANSGAQFQDVVVIGVEPPLTRITSNSAVPFTGYLRPVISGDKIVWVDGRNSNGGFDVYKDIYLYDLSTKTERRIVSARPRLEQCIDMSNNRIIWRESYSSVQLYDLTTNTMRQITDSSNYACPAISGDKIVWVHTLNSNTDIYLYDLSTNTERQITTGPSYKGGLAISGNRIVWEDNRNLNIPNSNNNYDIYLYDLTTNTERQITTDRNGQWKPRVSGNWIVWRDWRSVSDIFLYDLTTNTERRITKQPCLRSTVDCDSRRDPDVSDSYVVWSQLSDIVPVSGVDIFAYDIPSGETQRITFDPSSQGTPVISGSRVVWWDSRNNRRDPHDSSFAAPDIYLYDLASRNHPPVLQPIGNQTVVAGQLLSFTVTASDPDGDALTLSATNLPAGSSFDPSTGLFSWTPSSSQAGTYPGVHFEVSDGQFTDAEDMTILVLPPPSSPPVLALIGNQTVVTGQLLSLTVTASDPDPGDTLSFSTSPLPAGASFNSSTHYFSWTPTSSQVGTYDVTFTVNDQTGLSDSETIQIAVVLRPANLLGNGGFELGKSEWSGWGTRLVLTTKTVSEGTTAAKISIKEHRIRNLTHRIVPVVAGARYQFSAAVKTIDLRGAAVAYIAIEWLRPGGGIARFDWSPYRQGTTNWTQLSLSLVAPPDATKARVRLMTEGSGVTSGTVYFDDARLEPRP